jgi:hypothetical protein
VRSSDRWLRWIYSSHSTDVIHTLNPQLKKAAVNSYADALRVIFIFQTVCNVIGFFTCLPIQEHALPLVHFYFSFLHFLISEVLTSGTHEEQQKPDGNSINGQNGDEEEVQGTPID